MKRTKTVTAIFIGTALLGCDLISDTGPMQGGDLDWARAIADTRIEELYKNGFVMYRIEATYLDSYGYLYDGAQHPYWCFTYINHESFVVLIVVHPDGSVSVEEYESYYDDEIDFDYTSSDVHDWISLSSYCYRYITGLQDDVCYGLYGVSGQHGSYVDIYLYDKYFFELARVEITPEDGEIYSFDLF